MSKLQFEVGFECECIIFGHRITDSELCSKLTAIHADIDLDDDGSIDCQDYRKFLTEAEKKIGDEAEYDLVAGESSGIQTFTAEIITPPLPAKEAFKVLSRVLALIRRYGFTNESCGCHVNISPVDKEKLKEINPLYLAYHPIFEEIAKTFDRDNNDFCLPNDLPGDIYRSIIYDNDGAGIQGDKEAAINFAPFYYPDHRKDRRLEVRAFGNTGYQGRHREIKSLTYRVFEAITNSTKYHFDYLKK